ncbi:MAG: CotH kinase family protein, partial [Gammaproteobacteria bacterium]
APAPAPPTQKVFEPVPSYESEYEALFSLDTMKTIHIRISEEEWNGLLNDVDRNPRSEVYRRADFYYGDDVATAQYVPGVGFRIRGNSFSRKRPETGGGLHNPAASLVRAHFKIKFNEQYDEDESAYGPPSADIPEQPLYKGRTFAGVRGLNLKFNNNDPTYMREVLSYDLFRRVGVHTLRQAYAKLYIGIGNEPERYMGVYLMGENLDKEWAKRRFDKNSYLFKCLYQQYGPADLSNGDRDHNANTGSIGEEITDPEFFGDPWSAYRPAYDLKTKDDEFLEAEDKLNDLIELLNGNPTQAQLAAAIDIPTLLKAQAVNVYLGMWDDYWRNGNNYYLFFDEISEKWFFVPYDYDITLFDNIFGIDGLATASFLRWGDGRLSGNPVLMDRVLSYSDFREQYKAYVRALYDPAEKILDINTLTQRLNEMRNVVQPHTSGYEAVDEIPYSSSHAEIQNFVLDRTAHAIQEIGN